MKQYNVVIIGAGNIGAFFDEPASERILTHAHVFYNSEYFKLKGFYDNNLKKAEEAASRWNCKAYESMDSALKNADVVCCTVPDEYHYDVLDEIARYNVRLVFTEKPLTKTLLQAEDIISIYREKNIPILVNYTRRFLDEIGLVKSMIIEYGSFIKGTGYYGKGIVHNGSHMIDLIKFILGDVTGYKKLDQVYDFYDDDPSVDARIEVMGGTLILQAVDCRFTTIFELDLLFEKARVQILESGFLIKIYEVTDSPVFKGYKNYVKTKEINVDFNRAFVNAAENIRDVLEGREKLISSSENAVDVMKICCELRGD
jgi:predicted dehydrogenase